DDLPLGVARLELVAFRDVARLHPLAGQLMAITERIEHEHTSEMERARHRCYLARGPSTLASLARSSVTSSCKRLAWAVICTRNLPTYNGRTTKAKSNSTPSMKCCCQNGTIISAALKPIQLIAALVNR